MSSAKLITGWLLSFLLFVFAHQVSAKNKKGEFEFREDTQTHHYKLPNGLTVVLTENPRSPVASIYHWVQAGSLHEKPGTTGLAHLFEHMMFRPVRPDQPSFQQRLKKLGGKANAMTRFGSTVYTTTVPHRNLKTALKFEADRFQNLKVNERLLKREKGAVRSEYQSKFDANPKIAMWNQMYRTAFDDHPFEWFITGYRKDLDRIKAQDANKFFQKYYRPNNTGLFISGNIKAEKLISKIQKLYGKWEKGNPSSLPEPQKNKKGFQFEEAKLPAQAKTLMIGYRIPRIARENYALMELVNHVAFGSKYSYLKEQLVHQKKLLSEGGSFMFRYDRGLMKTMMNLYPKTEYNTVISQMGGIIDWAENLSEKEWRAFFENYEYQIKGSVLRNRQLNSLIALFWGKYHHVSGLKNMMNRDFQVKPEDIIQFMKQYFNKSNMIAIKPKESQ